MWQWMDQLGAMTKGRWACVIVFGGIDAPCTAQPSNPRFDQRRKATDVFQFADFRGGKFHFEGLFHGHH
jgi:hypothetical protein